MYIEPMPESIYQGTANDGTQVIHQEIEKLIQRFPEHYHWSYKRFKANPELRNLYNLPHEQAMQLVAKIREQQMQPID
jgi:KDO2-lipid IV(A) lauroyltransferase